MLIVYVPTPSTYHMLFMHVYTVAAPAATAPDRKTWKLGLLPSFACISKVVLEKKKKSNKEKCVARVTMISFFFILAMEKKF